MLARGDLARRLALDGGVYEWHAQHPRQLDERASISDWEQVGGQDRDRAGDEGDPGQSYPRAFGLVAMSCTVSRTTPGGHSRTNSHSPESTTTTSSISPITGTKSGMTSSGEIT